MTDEQVLRKLNEIQGLKTRGEVDKYLASWIEETKVAIALECNESLSKNPVGKVYKKYIEKLKKQGKQYHILKGTKRNQWILNYGAFAIRSKNDMGLPSLDTHKDMADKFISYVDKYSKACSQELRLPSIQELRAKIKETKALPKDKRPKVITYDFGNKLPQVDADLLLDLLSIFPDRIAWVAKEERSRSPLYFKLGQFDAVLLPVTKIK